MILLDSIFLNGTFNLIYTFEYIHKVTIDMCSWDFERKVSNSLGLLILWKMNENTTCENEKNTFSGTWDYFLFKKVLWTIF